MLAADSMESVDRFVVLVNSIFLTKNKTFAEFLS